MSGDGCTWWPDGTWAGCCAAHDLAYGTQAPRLDADLDLARCVFDTTGSGALALVMLAGVLAFGGVFRWLARRWSGSVRKPAAGSRR